MKFICFIKKNLYQKIIITSLSMLGIFSSYTWASEQTWVDLSAIEVTPHELALTQVLSEICPPLLNVTQNNKFQQVYQHQLQFFMPTLNTALAMQQINDKKEYHHILKGIRAWTLSFPKEENKALCVEFAESKF